MPGTDSLIQSTAQWRLVLVSYKLVTTRHAAYLVLVSESVLNRRSEAAETQPYVDFISPPKSCAGEQCQSVT